MKKTYAKFQNDRYKIVRGIALIRGAHCLYNEGEHDFHNAEKVTKNVPRIIPKSHAHPYTMKKTRAKFQNDQYKTVRGVALTRGTSCLYTEGEND